MPPLALDRGAHSLGVSPVSPGRAAGRDPPEKAPFSIPLWCEGPGVGGFILLWYPENTGGSSAIAQPQKPR